MNTSSPLLTFVVTCKGRLHHLRESLPLMVSQPLSTTIVVDADCPDGTATWVETHQPRAKVLRIASMPRFSAATARNVALPHITTPWICFVDADVLLAQTFASRVAGLLTQHSYCCFDQTKDNFGIMGTCLVETETIRRMGGYDDVPTGYGGEDMDLFERLDAMLLNRIELPPDLISGVIQHAFEDRTKFMDEKDHRYSIVVNGVYRALKRHVRNTHPKLEQDRPLREKIYAEARRAVEQARAAGADGVELDIPLPPDPAIYARFATMRQTVRIRLSLHLS